MQSSPCSEERKGRVSPGVMESEIPFDYYWRNKEWIFCKKKDSNDSRKYKVYVYDVKKVKQIKLS